MHLEVLQNFIQQNQEELYRTLQELCQIPAPSHFEHDRAEYCKNWLIAQGASGTYVDEAQNVIFPLNCEDSKEIAVIAAHMDTVFPDREPFAYIDDGETIRCPGVADDTASVVVLMLTAKYFIENKLIPRKGILFVCNSCEEGLGNLKGIRQLFQDYEGRIGQFVSRDSNLNSACISSVGSHRYQVEVITEGGHSYSKFGNVNAIAELSKIIAKIYEIQVPKIRDSRTTYNVGSISGGTSVNTIAQSARMLCEYRSDNVECLAQMRDRFEEIFESSRAEKVAVNVTLLGERPCDMEGIDKVQEPLIALCRQVIEGVIGTELHLHSGSTDCNIPRSLGIPAIAVGVRDAAGIHTREECMDKKSVITGLEIALKLVMALADIDA